MFAGLERSADRFEARRPIGRPSGGGVTASFYKYRLVNDRIYDSSVLEESQLMY